MPLKHPDAGSTPAGPAIPASEYATALLAYVDAHAHIWTRDEKLTAIKAFGEGYAAAKGWTPPYLLLKA